MKAKSNLFKTSLIIGFFAFGLQGYAQDSQISENELPSPAQEFLSKNFSGKKLIRIEKDVDRNSTGYEVRLDGQTKVEFDQGGNWEEVDGKNNAPIPNGFIPKKIKTYVAKNYPAQQISKIEKNSRKFEVELTNDLGLDFDLNGNFLRIDR
jgi:hypothetical protein